MRKSFLLLFAISTLANAQTLDDILNSEHRSAPNKARDHNRNPLETLNFFPSLSLLFSFIKTIKGFL